MDFNERKKKRREHFEKNVKGWKERPCTACHGSGYYDHNGSPKCGACCGTGKETYNPNLATDYKSIKIQEPKAGKTF